MLIWNIGWNYTQESWRSSFFFNPQGHQLSSPYRLRYRDGKVHDLDGQITNILKSGKQILARYYTDCDSLRSTLIT